MSKTVTRRSVLAGLAAGVAGSSVAVAAAHPAALESLISAYQAALAEYEAAADALDTIEMSIPEPRVEIGRYITLDGGEDEPFYARSPNEILRHFRAAASGLDSEEMCKLCRERDARLAEFRQSERAQQAALTAAGHAAACERSQLSGEALAAAEDAVLAHRPADMDEARAKARFVLTMPAFEDELALLAFARALAG